MSSETRQADGSWLVNWQAGEAGPHVVAIGYAGSGAAPFKAWGRALPSSWWLWSFRLPGRESRIRETPVNDLDRLVWSLTADVIAARMQDVCLVGVCSGAITAFEIARAMRRAQRPPPQVLMAVSQEAPRLRARRGAAGTAGMDPWERIEAIGSASPTITANAALRRLLEPALRADFLMADSYTYEPEPPLDCDILALAPLPAGNDDGVAGWRHETCGSFEEVRIAGDHLFSGDGQWQQIPGALVRHLTSP